MTGYREDVTTRFGLACKSLFLLLILGLVYGSASAQGGPPTDRERNVTEIERTRDDIAAHDARAKQFQEDFLGIQSVDADMMKVFGAGNSPDYKRIRDDSAEILKRANRIKAYLMLPSAKREKSTNSGFDPDRLESTLPTLKDLIQDFVKSPIFQTQAGRADSRELAKARHTIDDIIDLSATVRKTSEKLAK
jgi:hypothetical protein